MLPCNSSGHPVTEPLSVPPRSDVKRGSATVWKKVAALIIVYGITHSQRATGDRIPTGNVTSLVILSTCMWSLIPTVAFRFSRFWNGPPGMILSAKWTPPLYYLNHYIFLNKKHQ